MEKIIEKIDNYNLFTNLIPGFLLLMFNVYYFGLDNIKIGEQIVVAYFAGMTLNRIGSIIIEKIIMKISKSNKEEYVKYIKASKNDGKIEVLLQERNTFRTICALIVVCIFEIPISKLIRHYKPSCDIVILILLFILRGFCLAVLQESLCLFRKCF